MKCIVKGCGLVIRKAFNLFASCIALWQCCSSLWHCRVTMLQFFTVPRNVVRFSYSTVSQCKMWSNTWNEGSRRGLSLSCPRLAQLSNSIFLAAWSDKNQHLIFKICYINAIYLQPLILTAGSRTSMAIVMVRKFIISYWFHFALNQTV